MHGPRVTVKLFGEEEEGALSLGGYLREADTVDDEDDDDAEEESPPQVGRPPAGTSDFKNFTDAEAKSLRRCLDLLQQGRNRQQGSQARSVNGLSPRHPTGRDAPLA